MECNNLLEWRWKWWWMAITQRLEQHPNIAKIILKCWMPYCYFSWSPSNVKIIVSTCAFQGQFNSTARSENGWQGRENRQWKLKVSKKASKMSNFQNEFNTKKCDSWSISHMIKKLHEESFSMKLTTYWAELIEPRNHKKNVLCEGIQAKMALFEGTLNAISTYSPWISGIDAEAIGISQLWGQGTVKLGGIWLTCKAEDFGAGSKSDGSIKEEHYSLAASLCGCWQPITYTYMGS